MLIVIYFYNMSLNVIVAASNWINFVLILTRLSHFTHSSRIWSKT